MKIATTRTAALVAGALMLALAPLAANAGPNRNGPGGGAPRSGAKSSVNRGGGGGMGGGGGGGGGMAGKNKYADNKPNRNNVHGGNTNVVVAGNGNNRGGGNRGGGNRNGYNNGYNNNYNNNGHWDNNDNDFLEFVGKTAAITAGVSVVAAVIGSTTNDKPSDCQQSMSNGQVYMNCNGTWYQPVMNNGQQQYTVIAPPH